MNAQPSFPTANDDEQLRTADRELAAFIGAVTKLYGLEQARLSAEDWLDEVQGMDSLTWAGARDWRAVTVSASARLASRLGEVQRRALAEQ